MLRAINLERSIEWCEHMLKCKLVKERHNPDYKYNPAFLGGASSLCRQMQVSETAAAQLGTCLHEPDLHLRHACWQFTCGVTCCLSAAGCICMLVTA